MIRQYFYSFSALYGVGVASFILYQHIESRQKLMKKCDSFKIDLK